MKNYITGFLLAYTILITIYAYSLHTGKVASNRQACVEHVGVVPAGDYLEELTKVGGK